MPFPLRASTAGPAALAASCATALLVAVAAPASAHPASAGSAPTATTAATTARSVAAVAAPSPAGDADGTGLHWMVRPGQRSLVIDVVDRTGAAWPVRAASAAWASGPVQLHPARACRTGVACVVVSEGAYGATGWLGTTTAQAGPMETFAGPVQVALNDSYLLSPTRHRAVVCHELGHALGLDHDPRPTSCLQPVPSAPTPDATDRAELAALYSLG